MARTLLKKFKDQVGRIVTVFKDTETRTYTIEEQLFDSEGNSMLVNSLGDSVVMISYSFPNRTSCFNMLHDKYKRETKFDV